MIKKILQSDFIFILFPFFFIIIFRSFGFDGLYGQDSYEYLRYTRALLTFYHEGMYPGDYFWPLYYPLIGSIISFITGHEILVLQLLSISMIAIIAVYLKKTIHFLYQSDQYSYYYIILFFIFSPYVIKIGTSIMSDMLSACFFLISFFHGICYLKNKKIKCLYFTSSFAIAAVMTRYATGILLFPLFIIILLTLYKHRSHIIHLIPIILFSLLLISPHLFIKSNNPSGFLQHSWLVDWNLKNIFSNEFVTPDGYQRTAFINFIYIFFNFFHPIYLFIGVLFLFFLKKNDLKNKWLRLLYISILCYAVFLGGIPFQNKRFLLLSFPLIMIVLYPAFLRIMSISLIIRYRYLLLTGCFLIQLCLNYISLKPLFQRVSFEKEIIILMNPYQNNVLYSFDVDIALQVRELLFEYHNMYLNIYTHFNTGDLILFNPSKFEEQWQNKNPMINWNHIQAEYKLKTLFKTSEGWLLLKIQGPK